MLLFYSCLALARSTPRKYSLVILKITGLSAKSAMKFGIAIRPLSVSAMFQTKVKRGDAADDDHDNENELVDLRGAEPQQVLHAA